MTKKLKWRLGKLPTSDEVLELVKASLITKEEAREILFSEVNEQEQSIDDLKSEIKFLRELTQKLSSKSQIVETIRYIEKPYQQWGWYQPYQIWCSSGTVDLMGNGTTYACNNNMVYTSTGCNDMLITNGNGTTSLSIGDTDFTEIKTF